MLACTSVTNVPKYTTPLNSSSGPVTCSPGRSANVEVEVPFRMSQLTVMSTPVVANVEGFTLMVSVRDTRRFAAVPSSSRSTLPVAWMTTTRPSSSVESTGGLYDGWPCVAESPCAMSQIAW